MGTGRWPGGSPVLLAGGRVDGGRWDRPREARPSWVLVKDEGLAGAIKERPSILGGVTRAVLGTFHSQPRP